MEIRRTRRRNSWERLISSLGYYPFSCRICRNRFVANRNRALGLVLMVLMWLGGAAILAALALWWV